MQNAKVRWGSEEGLRGASKREALAGLCPLKASGWGLENRKDSEVFHIEHGANIKFLLRRLNWGTYVLVVVLYFYEALYRASAAVGLQSERFSQPQSTHLEQSHESSDLHAPAAANGDVWRKVAGGLDNG
jgi:hypothetical protein